MIPVVFSRQALEVLKELLEKKGDLNARDGNGWTAIHHACRNGKIEAARLGPAAPAWAVAPASAGGMAWIGLGSACQGVKIGGLLHPEFVKGRLRSST